MNSHHKLGVIHNTAYTAVLPAACLAMSQPKGCLLIQLSHK